MYLIPIRKHLFLFNLSLLIFIFLSPFLALIPNLHQYKVPALVIVGLAVMATLILSYRSKDNRRTKISAVFLKLAGISLGATLVFFTWPMNENLNYFTSNTLGPYFGLNGEIANEAASFEAFIELWLFLAGFLLITSRGIGFITDRRKKNNSKKVT